MSNTFQYACDKHRQDRATIRQSVRNARKSLTCEEQKTAETALCINFSQHVKPPKNAKIALYLSNDGELKTNKLIQYLIKENHTVYLPVIHPFNGTTLLFQKYEENSPMIHNRYAILEPELNCSHICPLYSLDYLFTPLVAFDEFGNRLGMGGGYYDKTLANYYRNNIAKPIVFGLAHDCQKVEKLPIAAWDVPLQHILTPTKFYTW
ncbi:5-formyltetrahydrofolate cyclo-ligase [Pseudoalteromonas aurantia]|uniref:5-formyltetrahydrofolate cyclo-ligase n=1 Tax=Pseudoalteromonas aurantia 208 TaxID=1314867 RepID=A0ABR9EGN0_9GAMM|nr:5-formyltetrahydrofolate cyclo-ligase [Pseudoalteromonas aurantia]MBE0369365.1 5-formyltetrahydrofolate cyclo-ligase [Pseudoalteromonas aurantia 208]